MWGIINIDREETFLFTVGSKKSEITLKSFFFLKHFIFKVCILKQFIYKHLYFTYIYIFKYIFF